MSPAAKMAASASSASCFRAKLPAKLAFVPYPWASSSLTMRWNRVPYFQTNLSCPTMNGDGLEEPKNHFFERYTIKGRLKQKPQVADEF